MDLNSFMADKTPPKPEPAPEQKSVTDAFAELPDGHIPEGTRNTTMSRLAGKLIKRYGNTRGRGRNFSKRRKPATRPWT